MRYTAFLTPSRRNAKPSRAAFSRMHRAAPSRAAHLPSFDNLPKVAKHTERRRDALPFSQTPRKAQIWRITHESTTNALLTHSVPVCALQRIFTRFSLILCALYHRANTENRQKAAAHLFYICFLTTVVICFLKDTVNIVYLPFEKTLYLLSFKR